MARKIKATTSAAEKRSSAMPAARKPKAAMAEKRIRPCLRARFELAPPENLRNASCGGTLFGDVDNEILDVVTPRPPKRFRFARNAKGGPERGAAADDHSTRESFCVGCLTRDELSSAPAFLQRLPSADLTIEDMDWDIDDDAFS